MITRLATTILSFLLLAALATILASEAPKSQAKPNAECVSLVRELDGRLQAQLKRIGDDFRPGKDSIAEWGYAIGSHGSVPYAAGITKVQTPRRNPAAKPAMQKPTSDAGNSSVTNGVPQK